MKFFSTAPGELCDMARNGMAIGIGHFSTGDIDVFTNYTQEWQNAYNTNGWITKDPVVATGLHRTGCYDWPAMEPDSNAFTAAAFDSGLRTGIVISQEIAGNRCIAGLCNDTPLSDAARNSAARAVRELHLDYLASRAVTLSQAQKDLVYLFANGFRAKQAADLFEISEDAIKQRKLSIQKHFGVNSFMVVINICARAGLTFHPIS